MPQDKHSIFRTDPHQEITITAKFFRAEGGTAVKIPHIAKHLTPLAGQQIDNINPFSLPFQQSRLRTEKVDVGIGRDPALFAPVQHPFQLKSDFLGLRGYDKLRAQRLYFIASRNLHKNVAMRQVNHTFAGNIAVLVTAVDELSIVVFKPTGVYLTMIPFGRQIFTSGTMQVQAHGNRRVAAPFDDVQPHWMNSRVYLDDAGFLWRIIIIYHLLFNHYQQADA